MQTIKQLKHTFFIQLAEADEVRDTAGPKTVAVEAIYYAAACAALDQFAAGLQKLFEEK